MPCSGVRNARVGAKRRKVGELSRSSRARTNELSKTGQIADFSYPPNVAFDVSLEIIAERLSRFEFVVV